MKLLVLLTFLLSGCNTAHKAAAPASSAHEPTAVSTPSVSPRDSLVATAIYSPEDSAKVVELLAKNPGKDDVLFYARQFLGVPYVAATLEKADPERLVVNLHQLDCTTLVETACALAWTRRMGEKTFADYCHRLEQIRYRKGENKGYLSRLHYFSWWMHDNAQKGLVKEVSDQQHCNTPITVNNYYMSLHPDRYPFLKNRPERRDSILVMEKAMNGPDGYYLSEEKTDLSPKELGFIRNGDIVAIVTTKKGIDYSHLGLAVWGKDHRLHLLNASSISNKVIEPTQTLRDYLKDHPSSIGIRVLRFVAQP